MTLVPHHPDAPLDAFRRTSPHVAAQLADGRLVVLVVGVTGEEDEVAAAIRKALAKRKPGRPRALSEMDLVRARGLMVAGCSIRTAAGKLGVSKSALDRALRGYSAGQGAEDDGSAFPADETFLR